VAPHPDNRTVLTFEDGQELAGEELAHERYVVLPKR
jgi:phosphoenolpyruvate carboxylase